MDESMPPDLSISVVSHRQGAFVNHLLQDIGNYCAGYKFEVILTLNVPEPVVFDSSMFEFPLLMIRNRQANGFGQNHNNAFTMAKGRNFCVLNPDIRLQEDPFPILLSEFADPSVGVSAPCIVDVSGNREDSARYFPTPAELMGKLFGRCSSVCDENVQAAEGPDWVAGMFMVFPREVFSSVGGFDERYFLYYEDVDICLRLRQAGFRVRLSNAVSAVHEARRSSHRNPRYMYWHLSSIVRFFLSAPYRKMRQNARG